MGAQARVLPHLPGHFTVADRTRALFVTDIDHCGYTYTESQGAVALLQTLFEMLWQVATPIAGPRHEVPSGLSDGQGELLRLMLSGRSNKAIASALRVTTRTISRQINELKTLFGVDTRAALVSAATYRNQADTAPPSA